MSIAVGLLGGLLGSLLLWRMVRPMWAAPGLRRVNVRGVVVPTAAGVVLVVVLLIAGAFRSVVDGPVNGAWGAWAATMVVATGFGLVGLVDDLAAGGFGGPAGFRGHLRALVGGRFSTGMGKLLGGGGVAIVAAVLLGRHGDGVGRLLLDAAVIALAANLVNLFDRAPGRAGKLGVVSGLVLLGATGAPAKLLPAAVVLGATAGLLVDDVRERLMLGDTGANALGGVLGAGLVAVASPGVRVGALMVLAALNAASEVVSFSRMIEAIPVLRVLDRAGRPRSD
jgi:UDP-GlcNAc:undecaprenyl-phosphate/decaprenyl-phosphate GlcNAc-1-phosphate transferase